jgi:hypothetical protein
MGFPRVPRFHAQDRLGTEKGKGKEMPLAPNQELFEYRIVRVLGQGAFGTVYACSGPISP